MSGQDSVCSLEKVDIVNAKWIQTKGVQDDPYYSVKRVDINTYDSVRIFTRDYIGKYNVKLQDISESPLKNFTINELSIIANDLEQKKLDRLASGINS